MSALAAPFPWFGGKRKVAPEVWAALGDPDNYVEPFAGSLAVLLGRPESGCGGMRRKETVNDADGFVCNAWRAIAADPEAVARWATGPLNETDLFARHLWLVNDGRSRLLHGMESDPDWYDVKIAGWWLWGIAGWIGSGWCSGTGPWVAVDGEVGKLPHLGNAGQGVNRQRPHLNAGRGVKRQLPHLGPLRGVKRQLPHLGNAGQGLLDYMAALAERLANVSVCNGDWSRVVTRGAMNYGTTVGIFLDPPYLGDVHYSDLYAVDDHTIAHAVRQWALDNGDDPRLRIVLAGYDDEHDHLIPDTWRRHRWSAGASYSTNRAAVADTPTGSHVNRHKEVLWMSPHCLDPSATPDQPDLFGGVS